MFQHNMQKTTNRFLKLKEGGARRGSTTCLWSRERWKLADLGQDQEGLHSEFQAILGYLARPISRKQKHQWNRQTGSWCHIDALEISLDHFRCILQSRGWGGGWARNSSHPPLQLFWGEACCFQPKGTQLKYTDFHFILQQSSCFITLRHLLSLCRPYAMGMKSTLNWDCSVLNWKTVG